jgi:hypothetical protein
MHLEECIEECWGKQASKQARGNGNDDGEFTRNILASADARLFISFLLRCSDRPYASFGLSFLQSPFFS